VIFKLGVKANKVYRESDGVINEKKFFVVGRGIGIFHRYTAYR
jgi:hypothetical protein